jgi:monovalent cation:H+ antiporter, CPA1 family
VEAVPSLDAVEAASANAHHSEVAGLVVAIVTLLLVAAGLLALSRHVRFPFTVLLVIFGVGIAEFASFGPIQSSGLLDLQLSRDVILYVFLPTLIFESAFNMDSRQLRDNLGPILALAVPGLLISTVIIASIVAGTTAVPFVAALVLGAILSATDPVAVIALFRQLGAPKRLTVLVEGESLFNDATAIVTANILLAVAMSGVLTAGVAFAGVLNFFVVFIGGIAVGGGLALVTGWLLALVHDDPAIEISLMTVLAYFSFIIAEEFFAVSGVMATLTAGLLMGNWGRTKVSPSVASYMEHFWEYVSYAANALIFLMVGLRVDFGGLVGNWQALAWVIFAMLLSRAIVIGGLVPLTGMIPGAIKVNWRYQALMYWGGLRGAVALAVALSLGDFAYSDLFFTLVLGAVLFTLLVNGLTVEPLMRLLGLHKPTLSDELARSEAQLEAVNRAVSRFPMLNASGLFFERITKSLEERYRREIYDVKENIASLRRRALSPTEERGFLYLRCLAMEKAAYLNMLAMHHISEKSFRRLNLATETQIDSIRHVGVLPQRTYYQTWTHKLTTWAQAIVSRMPFATHVQDNVFARDYEIAWGRHQAAQQVTNLIHDISESGVHDPALVDELKQRYKKWHQSALDRLDGWAEQYPDFVGDMQELLAERLILSVEADVLAQEVENGSIAHTMGEAMLAELRYKIRKLAIPSLSVLNLEPATLLATLPFLSDASSEDLQALSSRLIPKTVGAESNIVLQGEVGKTLYLISRGVVRVYRHEQTHDTRQRVATLIAGDYFGEFAFLTKEPRNATCKSVTACSLYELSRADFNAVLSERPSLREIFERQSSGDIVIDTQRKARSDL